MDFPTVKPLEKKYLEKVIQIHQAGLGYTFNSRLGAQHLSLLYEAMMQSDDSHVGVVIIDNQPVGVVSGTLDIEKLKNKAVRKLRIKHIINLCLNFLFHPTLLLELQKGNLIGKNVTYAGKIVSPVLTAIVVDSNFQGRGIGKLLVKDLENFFRQHHVSHYRLDTLQENTKARTFYENLGFQKVEDRADSTIHIKEI